MQKMINRFALAFTTAVIAAGVYLGGIQLTGNFHEVMPGQLYRSNQPSASQIARYSGEYGIKTIINLRGVGETDEWYQEEKTAADHLGLVHIDFPMSASKQLTMAESNKLIEIMRDAPKPILIHCRSGSDRTGLASVIYLNRIAGVDEAVAENQLSIRFGHIGIPYLSRTYAMDETWEKLETAFGI